MPSAASSNHDKGCFEIEAMLTSFLPTILRHEAGLKRDYYRAITTLLELQELSNWGEKIKIMTITHFAKQTH